MKNKGLFMAIVLQAIVLMFSACMTSYYNTMYEVNETTVKDISGDRVVKKMLIDRESSALGGGYSSTSLSTAGGQYGLLVEYHGPSWRFIDAISIKTDNGVTELETSTPDRDVISGGGGVTESIVGLIPPDVVEQMKSTKTFTLQYKGRLAELPEEAVSAIREFVSQ
ncbi:hypothetical protein ACYULU_07985 [Breznakiellaceae bacterium SP9]